MGMNTRYKLLCFVSKDKGAFKIEPPFDIVDIEDIETGNRSNVAFDQIDFSIEKILQG